MQISNGQNGGTPTGSPSPTGSPTPTPTASPTLKPTPAPINFVPTSQFGVYNNCSYPVWLQAINQPSTDNSLIKLMPQGSYSYAINGQPVNSFNVVPKSGCDSSGNNCDVGQSLAPCPSSGCQPPIDSLFEGTFNSSSGSFFDVSAVNGFTIPYNIQVTKASDETNPACTNSYAFNLNPNNCPTNEDLSTPTSEMTAYGSFATFGPFPSLTNQNLQVTNPNTGHIIGCAAPYQKLIMSTNWGGLHIGANSNGYSPDLYNQVFMYACQPSSSQLINDSIPNQPPGNNAFNQISAYCNSSSGPCNGTSGNPNGPQATDTFKVGPITKTQYVNYIHNVTTDVYAWQYDDVNGTHVCSSNQSKAAFILCP